MQTEQYFWSKANGWNFNEEGLAHAAQLVLVFGNRHELVHPAQYKTIRERYPNAEVVLASTAGEILQTEVKQGGLVLTAVSFQKSQVHTSSVQVAGSAESYTAGRQLIEQLPLQGLVHVLVLSDGQLVNGSDLVKGLNDALPAGVQATGGLAGDDLYFEETVVGLNNPPAPGHLVAIGFYGNSLQVGWGSGGGWDSFGPDRIITRSSGNVLYELDGKPALDLYIKYLGPRAAELPASALLFPLSLRMANGEDSVVRTVLHINEREQSMIFAGDVTQGARIRLMKANFDRLVDGAILAADQTMHTLQQTPPELAILISCVGRRAVLGQRIEEELEEVQQVFGTSSCLTGFYSYGELSPLQGELSPLQGEISPLYQKASTELHNQTLTITALREL